MRALVVILALAAAAAEAADADRLPPQTREAPSIRDLSRPGAPPAIFTYTLDAQCRVDRVRKLQGADDVTWQHAQRTHEVFQETTVWRFVDGLRRQLRERRVKLLGEMIDDGELVCRVLPSGDVVEAWIERRDDSPGRRQAPRRESLNVSNGAIGTLGTFSLDVESNPASDGDAAPPAP